MKIGNYTIKAERWPWQGCGMTSILRTIPVREIAGWFLVFGLLAVVAAGFVVVAS